MARSNCLRSAEPAWSGAHVITWADPMGANMSVGEERELVPPVVSTCMVGLDPAISGRAMCVPRQITGSSPVRR